jgi:hypothetical protein
MLLLARQVLSLNLVVRTRDDTTIESNRRLTYKTAKILSGTRHVESHSTKSLTVSLARDSNTDFIGKVKTFFSNQVFRITREV